VSIVSFLSDFGHRDEFVGVVHGVIARIAPEVRVIDIGHEFAPGDVRSAALALLRAIQYIPQGVALAVVDPGVGTARRPIVAGTEWGYFVGPDNGLLAPAVAMVGGAGEIRVIENPDLRLAAEGATFQGRDVFAPVAAVLASGQARFEEVGPEVDPASVTPLMIALVEPDGSGGLLGEVLWVDRFGNCQTNIAPADLEAAGLTPGDDVVVQIGGGQHRLRWVSAYGDVEEGEALLHVDSYGQMAIAVRAGRADEEFPLAERMAVTLRRPSGGSRIPITG
jgi:S-adenosyl-L-methionine hydrolase (adenosine-forming)